MNLFRVISPSRFIPQYPLEGRMFANSPGDLGSIPGRVMPKTLKMVLDTSLLNTQQYKVRIKGSSQGKGIAVKGKEI